MLAYVLLIIGFVLLIKGADFFVDGSCGVARLLRIPSVIIGLTVVAFGTSMPEASVSINAALEGANELSLSNVIGSNIFNLLVVTGVCAAIRPLPVTASVMKKEFPFSIVITGVLLVMSLDTLLFGGTNNTISRINGMILLVFFVAFVASTVRDALRSRRERQDDAEDFKPLHPVTSILYIVGGLAGIVIGGDLVVQSASQIAASFGLSQTLIGLTIVALGTSLPELVTSIMAARKGENDIALGNVVGSNIFNILLVLGASAALHPVEVNRESIYDILILIVTSIMVYLFGVRQKNISRWEGILMLAAYVAFFFFITMRDGVI